MRRDGQAVACSGGEATAMRPGSAFAPLRGFLECGHDPAKGE